MKSKQSKEEEKEEEKEVKFGCHHGGKHQSALECSNFDNAELRRRLSTYQNVKLNLLLHTGKEKCKGIKRHAIMIENWDYGPNTG